MGMNWGAFAGAAAQSGLSTYERLEEQKLKQLQRSQLEKEIAEKEALDTAWRNSQARVGQQDDYAQAIKTGAGVGTEQAQMLSSQGALAGNTAADQDFERASAQAATGAMRENAVRQGAIPESQAAMPEMKPSEYTKAQGMEDYVKSAAQVSRKGTMEAIQLKQMVQQSEAEDNFRKEQTKLNDTLARIQGTAESGGLKGLYEAGRKEGLKLSFVEGKNGIGSRINVLGPKGDVLETVSDITTATDKLSQAAMQQFMQKSVSLLGSPDKVLSYMQGEKKLAIQEKEAKDKGNYYSAYGDYLRSGGSGGKTGKDNIKTRAYEYGDLLFEAGEKNPQTGKPFASQAEARKYSLALALKAPEAKGITANPDGSIIQNGVLYVPDPKKPGGYVPATGLPNSPRNSLVAAFANYDPSQKNGPRTALPPKALKDETNP